MKILNRLRLALLQPLCFLGGILLFICDNFNININNMISYRLDK